MNNENKLCVCTGCKYYRNLGCINSVGDVKSSKACHYCIDTGQVRGIPPSECYKHEGTPYTTGRHTSKNWMYLNSKKKEKIKGDKKMAKRITFSKEIKEAAVKAVLVDKEPQEVVRERYGIAVSTLGKWLTEARREQQKYFDYADTLQKELPQENVVCKVADIPAEQPAEPDVQDIPDEKCCEDSNNAVDKTSDKASDKTMLCETCLHKKMCIYRARALLSDVFVVEDCASYLPVTPSVDIYQMAEDITQTVKQVVLASLRNICDDEED